MHLDGISLQHFRAYTQHTFLFPQRVTVVVGQNASGKTSLIEAIQLLATGESFRAEEVAEMIQFSEELGRVKGKVDGEKELEVTLTRGIVQGKKTVAKLYAVNQVRRLKKNFLGNLSAVVFRPEDLRLIEGSPSRRRQFVDTALCMTNPSYAVALHTYEQALKRRNRFLQLIQEGKAQRTVLPYWTQLLLTNGLVLQEQRRQFFAACADVSFPLQFAVEYMPSVMSEARLTEYQDRELAAGHTLIGPHKDDFVVTLDVNGPIRAPGMVSVMAYGSRGQQRLAVLWLKMCEVAFVVAKTGQQPLLLLDDIFSELDASHRQDVCSLVQQGQAIITTTEESVVREITEIVGEYDCIHLSDI